MALAGRRLSHFTMLGYGAAAAGISGADVVLRLGLLIFYTQEVGLEPFWASLAIALGVFWDAVTDPFMGRYTDQACIAGQRRRPFFIPGALGLALAVVMIFHAPQWQSQIAKFGYLLGCYLLLNTFFTILAVPHTALAVDMTDDPKERLTLFGWRMLCDNLGMIAGTLIPVFLLGAAGSEPQERLEASSSVLLAVMILMTAGLSFWATRGWDQVESRDVQSSQRMSYFDDLRQLWQHRRFTALLFAYMIAQIGLTLNSSLAFYYYEFFLELPQSTVRGIIAFFIIILCFAIPLWIYLARFYSKMRLLQTSVTLLALMTAVCYPLFPAGQVWGPLLASVLGGILVAAIVLMDVLVADLAEKASGPANGQAGLYFGAWKMGGKASRALGLMVAGQMLQLIGFSASATPGEEVVQALSWVFGPGVAGFLLVAVVVMGYVEKLNSDNRI